MNIEQVNVPTVDLEKSDNENIMLMYNSYVNSQSIIYRPSSFSQSQLTVDLKSNTLNTLLDRALRVYYKYRIVVTGTVTDAQPLIRLGLYDSIASFPFHKTIQNLTLQINDNSKSEQTNVILPIMLYCLFNRDSTDYLQNGFALDYYANSEDAFTYGVNKKAQGYYGELAGAETGRASHGNYTIISNTPTGAEFTYENNESLLCEPFLMSGNKKALAYVNSLLMNISFMLDKSQILSHITNSTTNITGVNVILETVEFRALQYSLSPLQQIANKITYNNSTYNIYSYDLQTITPYQKNVPFSFPSFNVSSQPESIYIFVQEKNKTQISTDTFLFPEYFRLQYGNNTYFDNYLSYDLFNMSKNNGLNINSFTEAEKFKGFILVIKPDVNGLMADNSALYKKAGVQDRFTITFDMRVSSVYNRNVDCTAWVVISNNSIIELSYNHMNILTNFVKTSEVVNASSNEPLSETEAMVNPSDSLYGSGITKGFNRILRKKLIPGARNIANTVKLTSDLIRDVSEPFGGKTMSRNELVKNINRI